jgi:hypothetical protein
MKKLLLLGLLGAALYVANTFTTSSSTCPPEEKKTTANVKYVLSPQPKAVSTPPAKLPQALKAAAAPTAPIPQDVSLTGSVKGQTAKIPTPNNKPVSSEIGTELSKVGGGQWVKVSLDAKMHNAPSVSAPIVRYYRVGTELRIIDRQPGWIKVAAPLTSEHGWIYEKYLTPKDKPDQTQAGLQASPLTNAVSTARLKKQPRQYGWKRRRTHQPPIGFVLVYPRW